VAIDSQTSEAAHHKFQRGLLGIKWYDNVSSVEVRKRTGMGKLEKIIDDEDGGLQNTEPSFELEP